MGMPKEEYASEFFLRTRVYQVFENVTRDLIFFKATPYSSHYQSIVHLVFFSTVHVGFYDKISWE